MKIKKFNWFLRFILFKNVIAITLCPFGIYYRDKISAKTKRHEMIHYAQQKEMFVIFFYLWYIIEWVISFFKYGKDAYYNISFEREAYKHDSDLSYNRKYFAWIKFIKL